MRTDDGLPEVLVDWIEAIRQKLTNETKSKPQPPKDQTRSATTNFKCEYCEQLIQFLRDSHQSQIEIKAAEHHRNHMASIIRSKAIDLASQQIRMGNRYALRFTKTTESYHRDLQRYEADLKLLKAEHNL